MKRRDALRNTALMLGYAVSATTVTAVLQGCINDNQRAAATSDNWSPSFFTSDEYTLISEMSETILPETQTPGAKSVGVPQFMDSMLADYYNAIQQRRFREGMQSLNQQAIRETGSDFMKMSTDQRAEFFTEVDKATIEQIRQGTGNYRPFFRTLKELTWIGFFTSETIGEEYLAYDPVPGRYDGCLPLEENGGKQWSL